MDVPGPCKACMVSSALAWRVGRGSIAICLGVRLQSWTCACSSLASMLSSSFIGHWYHDGLRRYSPWGTGGLRVCLPAVRRLPALRLVLVASCSFASRWGVVVCWPAGSALSRRRPWKASCLSCVGSRSWSLRLWSSSFCWLELPLLLALVVLFFLDFVDFLAVSVFGPFCGRFPSCGVPARWRDLRHVVLDTCRK